MNRREFLATGVATATASLLSEGDSDAEAIEIHRIASMHKLADQTNLTIRDYLVRQARASTKHALAEYRSAADWTKLIPEKRRQYREMMGVEALWRDARGPVPVHVTGEVDRAAYKIVKLHYESLPDLHVTANLYLPTK